MKKIYQILGVPIGLLLLSGTAFGQYCSGGPTSNAYSNIDAVTMTGDNGSQISYTGVCPGVIGLEDQTAQVVEIEAGVQYTIEVTYGSCSGNYSGAGEVWIDYNQNNVFDTGESIGSSTGTPGTAPWDVAVPYTFTVPLTAAGGITRIRVHQEEFGSVPANPCDTYTWGSMIDFGADVTPAPSNCPFPTGLTATATSQQDVDLSWTAGGSETTWNVEWGAPGFTPGTGTEIGSDVVTTTPTLSVSGLTPFTDYDFYVQADCGGGDLSFWTGAASVFTGYCSPTYTNTTEWLASFETNNATQNFSYTALSQPAGGMENLTATDTIKQIEGLDVDIDYAYSLGGSNTVKVWIDWNNDLIFDPATEEVYSLGATSSPQSGTMTIPIGTPVGVYTMRVRATWGAGSALTPCGTNTWGSGVDLMFEVETLPSCPQPYSIGLVSSSGNSLEIDWSDLGAANSYTIEWGNPGFTPGTGGELGSMTTTNLQDVIAGLDGNTTYDIYIQGDCGGGDISDWSSVATYTTQCTALIAPFAENFDGVTWTAGTGFNNAGDVLDNCWSRDPIQPTSNVFWGVRSGTTGSSNTGPDSDASGTGNYMFIESGNGSNGDSAFLYSPLIDLSSLTLPELEFSYHMFGATVNELRVDVSDDNGVTWQNEYSIEGQQQTAGSDPWDTFSVILADFIGQTVQLRFVGIKGSSFTGDLAIDEVTINEGPSCPQPTSLSVSSITDSDALIEWNAGYLETEWEIEYDTTGFTPGTGTVVSTTNNPETISGLMDNTSYDVYVRAICAPGDESVWIGPTAFNTQCVVFAAPYLEDFDGPSWVSGTGFSNVDSEISECWSRTPNTSTSFFWGTREGTTSSNFNTGPEEDVSGNGNYIFTESSNGSFGSPDTAVFHSPSVDLSTINDAQLTFSYFMRGNNIDSLNVYISNDNGTTWDSLLTIENAQQTAIDDAWIDTVVSLDAYEMDTVIIRFLNVKGGSSDDIAIDEFSILSCIPDGGVDNEADICRLDEEINLNDQITINQGGGKWSFPPNQSAISNNLMLDITSLPAGAYDAYYIVPGACEDDTTTATLNIFQPSSAGENGTLIVCRNQPVDLFSGLNGNVDMGGTWYDPSDNALPNSQPFSSNIQGSYNYDYVVSNGVCPADTQFVEVLVDECDWMSVEEEEMKKIEVYPNPASDILNINNGSNMEHMTIEMFDMNGRVVYSDDQSLSNTDNTTISIDHLEKGIYTLRVGNQEGQKTFKIVKH